MLKRFSLIMLVLMLGVFMAACSSNDAGKAGGGDKSGGKESGGKKEEGKIGGEITVWAHPFTNEGDGEKKMWQEIISNFESEHDVKVNFEQIPWANRDQKILTALAANNGPDIFYAIPDQMPQYADAGMLLELDSYLDDADMDDFVDTALVSTTWKDKTYGLPILQEAYTLFYNTDVIKEIGEDPEKLPATWDEFKDWAKKAKDKGLYATSYQGGGSLNSTLYPYVWQAGGEVVTENNEVMINKPEAVKAFELINEMYKNGWIPEDSITAMEHEALWDSGKMLAVIGSGVTLSQLAEQGKENFVIAPPLKEKEQVTYGTTGMFVVPVSTDNPATAAEFVKFMTNAENQRSFNKVTKYIPTRESAKDIFDGDEHLSQLAGYTQYALPGVIHPAGRAIMPKIQAELQTMMEGKKSPQEAADAAAEAVEAELKK